jgi:hypothetical protein
MAVWLAFAIAGTNPALIAEPGIYTRRESLFGLVGWTLVRQYRACWQSKAEKWSNEGIH